MGTHSYFHERSREHEPLRPVAFWSTILEYGRGTEALYCQCPCPVALKTVLSTLNTRGMKSSRREERSPPASRPVSFTHLAHLATTEEDLGVHSLVFLHVCLSSACTFNIKGALV